MNEWNDGYFTSDTYTYGYYRELSPTFQRFMLILRGFEAPELDENSVHCELGFGQGVSVAIHAASKPGKYYGTDFNPSHAAHANKLAKAAECNAKFFDDSFEQMLNREDLPQFDSISLHGIWSWISTENQHIVVEFARRFLKSGGVFYNSYNCFPGWAPNSPIREMLSLYDKYAGSNNANTYKRVEAALKFAEDLLAAKPIYAAKVPGITATLESTKKYDHNYLAHEYLNRYWTCMYFSEVAEILSAAKLEFACTALPADAIDQMNLTSDAIKFLSTIENPIIKEQARDYFVNSQFRKDLYIRGTRKLNSVERMKQLLNIPFVLTTTDKIEKKCKTVLGEMTFNNPNFDAVMEYLVSDNYRPKKFADLLKDHPEIIFTNLEQLIVILTNTGSLMPCQEQSSIDKVKKNCDKLNAYLCQRAENSTDIAFLASPVLGGALSVGRFQQIFVQSYKSGKEDVDGLVKDAWGILEAQNQRLLKEGKTLETPEENINEFKSMATEFLEKRLPILKALQII